MFSFVYIFPLLINMLREKSMPVKFISAGVIFFLFGSAFLYDWNSLLLFVSFPSIKVDIGFGDNFLLYYFVAAIFCLLSLVREHLHALPYFLGFGLVASSGDPFLLLALLLVAKMGNSEKTSVFALVALLLLGELVSSARPDLDSFNWGISYASMGAVLTLFFLLLLRPFKRMDQVLDIAVYAILINAYATRLGLMDTVTTISIFAAVTITLIKLVNFKFWELLLPLTGLIVALLIAAEGLNNMHSFGGAMFIFLMLLENKSLSFKGAWRPPQAQWLSIYGYYLAIIFLLSMIFKYEAALGWFSIIGLQIARKGVVSLGGRIREINSPLVAMSSLALFTGFLMAILNNFLGGQHW